MLNLLQNLPQKRFEGNGMSIRVRRSNVIDTLGGHKSPVLLKRMKPSFDFKSENNTSSLFLQ